MQGTQGIGGALVDMSAMQLWQKTIELNRLRDNQDTGITGQARKIAKLETEIRTGKIECQTCKSRRYVDRSNDPSVSFKTPQNVSPSQSLGAVLSHENEHVRNENANAARENREVVQSSVTIEYAICPECGARYVAGGETTTVTRAVSNKQAENTENMVNNKAGSGDSGKSEKGKLNLLV
jgi:DNA-directed RNA polymerase subunit RPC12/RpoP